MAFVSSFTGVSLAQPTRAAVSARRAPVRHARQSRMTLAPLAQQVSLRLNDAAILLSAKDVDFGGYTGPIIGLLTIAVIIAVLTPPVKE
ncbi:hypothetical protein BWQ96_02250 [Gracilariopsis chorda]|uniref:Uncharacterized protein n=1 Tax=Gracilariopsis chorda TaxID=448386 RepID=A0A2V3J0D8_9FLOR|nr:hypothetical protein BWQ96_02250 [Gracilariopsis chorda]|eukprot:PXF47864.1 hypothetical protein BWQ96_02250 [Gracilariopsis chorda]